MATEQRSRREVGWADFLGWLAFLGRSFRLALAPRVLFLVVLGLIATTAGWRILSVPFLPQETRPYDQPISAVSQYAEVLSTWPWQQRQTTFNGPMGEPLQTVDRVLSGEFSNPLYRAWNHLSGPFRASFSAELTAGEFLYLFLCGIWGLGVWSLIGGAVTRIAAVSLAREDRLAVQPAVSYALSKWKSYFSAPLFPLLGAFMFAAPMVLVGLLQRADWGVMLAGVLWPLVIFGALVMAIILVGLAFGWPLMWTTISVEATDAFDALSRSYAYTLQRPLHYLFYVLVASVLGILGWLFVSLLTETVLGIATWSVSWGTGGERLREIQQAAQGQAADGALGTGLAMITFVEGLAAMLPMAFVYAFFWTSATAIYFLLRHHVDQTELDEIVVLDEVFAPEDEDSTAILPPSASSNSGSSDLGGTGNQGPGGTGPDSTGSGPRTEPPSPPVG